MQRYPKVMGFDLLGQIGGGGFSTVYRAVNINDHRVAACKLIRFTEETTEKDRKDIEKEMRIHASLKHTHVVEFLNAVVVELRHRLVYVPGIYMLLEFGGGGDLFDKIAPNVGVDDDVAQLYLKQLVAGMDYIHNQGVCHRDLKPENILLDAAGTLKISDFGLSAVFMLKETGETRMLSEKCGSLPYIAPELYSPFPYKARPVDVWGIGIILFALLVGDTPWDEPTDKCPEFVRYVNGQIFCERPWDRIPQDPLYLITGMLTINPERRMTLDEIISHPWYMNAGQLHEDGPLQLAIRLTRGIKDCGDMDVCAPPTLTARGDRGTVTGVESVHDPQSQFTQTLMLFSQTQSGSRYTPHLTRFYATLGPTLLLRLVHEALEGLNVKAKVLPPATIPGSIGNIEMHRLRIGGWDGRRQRLKGWVEIEEFKHRGFEGSYCLMRRDDGSPISWRQLWRTVVQSTLVHPHVLKK